MKAFTMLALPWALIMGASACSFPRPQSDGEERPDAGVDAPVDPSDVDGDGHKNEVDNCPNVANADQADGDGDLLGDLCDNCPSVANPRLETMGLGLIQRDHDEDGRGDACDLCPHLASAGDPDADADGIGAACDPDDAVKNPPAEFNGFYDPPSAAEWMAAPGGGVLSDWEHVQTADKRLWWKQKTLDSGRHQLLRNRADIDEVRVDTSYRIHAVYPADGASLIRSTGISFAFSFEAGVSSYFDCHLRHNLTSLNSNPVLSSYSDDISTDEVVSGRSIAFLERDFRTEAEHDSRQANGYSPMSCRIENISNMFGDSTLDLAGKIGLRTFGMTASFDYVFIVDKAAAP